MSDEDIKVCEAMRKYGGGFVQQLAEAAFHADSKNLDLLKATFADKWTEYKMFADFDERKRKP